MQGTFSDTYKVTEAHADAKSTISDEISHENDIIKNLMATQNTDYYDKKRESKLITDKKRFN